MRSEHIVPPEKSGSRLDAFVSEAFGLGVRAAKRMAEGGLVLVDDAPRPAHFKLSPGMTVAALETPGPETAVPRVTLVAATSEYAVFFKPAGLHSARIAGNARPSLEEAVALQWDHMRASPRAAFAPAAVADHLAEALGGNLPVPRVLALPLPAAAPVLLNRLDKPTSGLVAAAFTEEAAQRFRDFEIRGAVEKRYLAVVLGEMTVPVTLRNALDTDNRKKTRALPWNAPDRTRHTLVTPLGPVRTLVPDAPEGCTLVAACIKRGARHQIRAHLAASGHPLAGDVLYGGGAGFLLHLHHARLSMPGLDAFCPPPWPHLP